MSDTYTPRRLEEFSRLEIFRRVESGASLFIDSFRSSVNEIVGQEATGDVPIAGLQEYIPAVNPYYDVVRPTDLKLELLTRRDSPENRPDSRYKEMKKRLVNGTAAITRKNGHEYSVYPSRPPLFEVLDRIQYIDFGIEAEDLEVDIVGIDTRFSADVQNGMCELVLLPEVSSRIGRMLLEQARYTHGRVMLESSRVGSGPSHNSLAIPFASVRKIPDRLMVQDTKLMKHVREVLLPFSVKLGKVEIL